MNTDSANKNTHSYTAQPIISRDGRLIAKLSLVLQESGDKFGPRVAEHVRQQEREYGNIRVYASKSGNMTKHLVNQWVEVMYSCQP